MRVSGVKLGEVWSEDGSRQQDTYVVDVEEEGIVDIGWRLRVRDPIQFIYTQLEERSIYLFKTRKSVCV